MGECPRWTYRDDPIAQPHTQIRLKDRKQIYSVNASTRYYASDSNELERLNLLQSDDDTVE